MPPRPGFLLPPLSPPQRLQRQPLPPRQPLPSRKCAHVLAARAAPSGQNASSSSSGVNVSKYKSQRSILSSDKTDITAEEVNALVVRAGKENIMKRNVVKYLLKDLRRTVPGCSIALFSTDNDRSFFEGLDFVADPDGIKGMALFDPSNPHYL